MNELHFKHWIQSDRMLLAEATTFKDIANVALAVMARMPDNIMMISGPISTGGMKSVEKNLKVFGGVIEILATESGMNMFSQMPFEETMGRLCKAWRAEHKTDGYCMPILEEFYEAVFSTGRVSMLCFVHDWESSFGARWEHANYRRWNIRRAFLPEKLSRRALELYVP